MTLKSFIKPSRSPYVKNCQNIWESFVNFVITTKPLSAISFFFLVFMTNRYDKNRLRATFIVKWNNGLGAIHIARCAFELWSFLKESHYLGISRFMKKNLFFAYSLFSLINILLTSLYFTASYCAMATLPKSIWGNTTSLPSNNRAIDMFCSKIK